jgi:hypothetical protein
VYIERDASGFDEEYYGKLLENAWQEVAYVFGIDNPHRFIANYTDK